MVWEQALAGTGSVTAVDLQVQGIGPAAKVVDGVVQQVPDRQLEQARCIVELVSGFGFAEQLAVVVLHHVADLHFE